MIFFLENWDSVVQEESAGSDDFEVPYGSGISRIASRAQGGGETLPILFERVSWLGRDTSPDSVSTNTKAGACGETRNGEKQMAKISIHRCTLILDRWFD